MNTQNQSTSYSTLTVAFAGALVIAATMGIGRFAYTPLLPGLRETLGWTVAQAGDVASANYLGYFIGAMLASLLVHRPQRHTGLFFGLIFSAFSTLACAWISAYPLWLLLRFISGFASAFSMILGTAIVVDTLSRRARPQLVSTHFSGLSLGIIGSVLIVELAALSDFSVFIQWGLLGITACIMLVPAWLVLRTIVMPAQAGASSVPTQQPHYSKPALQRLIVAYGLFGFGYVVTATFIVAIAREIDGTVFLEAATWITVGLVGAPSLFLWQYFSRRFDVFIALRLAFAIEAIGVWLAGIADTALAVILGGALLGATFMAITSMGFVAARQVAGVHQDKAIAWMTVAFGLGQLLGPAIAGRMAEASGSFSAPSILASVLLILGVLLIKNK